MSKKRQPNFRKALEQMLEYIKDHRICVEEAMYMLSDEVMLKNALIVQTLEEIGCIQLLGRLNHKTGAKYRRAYGMNFVQLIHDRATRRKIKCPWGRKLWWVSAIRADQINPQLLLSRPLLEKVEKLYGHDPQVRVVAEDEGKMDDVPWRAEP